VITGAPEYLDGLIGLDFVPLSIAAWNKTQVAQFIQKWGELWTRLVAVEAWAQSSEHVDPLLLNAWLDIDNQKLSPFELTLKLWAGYAGDSPGSHVLDAISAHIRRLSPENTPPAALETLAMQVVVNGQPVFDVHSAREWVKSFEAPEEPQETQPGGQPSAEGAEVKETEEKETKKEKKNKVVAPTPSAVSWTKSHPPDY